MRPTLVALMVLAGCGDSPVPEPGVGTAASGLGRGQWQRSHKWKDGGVAPAPDLGPACVAAGTHSCACDLLEQPDPWFPTVSHWTMEDTLAQPLCSPLLVVETADPSGCQQICEITRTPDGSGGYTYLHACVALCPWGEVRTKVSCACG